MIGQVKFFQLLGIGSWISIKILLIIGGERLLRKSAEISDIGLEERYYSSGHSLRALGATDLFVCRVPYYIIKKMGRCKSETAMLYYRCDEDVKKEVAAAYTKLFHSEMGW